MTSLLSWHQRRSAIGARDRLIQSSFSVSKLADVEQFVVEKHEEDSADEKHDNWNDDILSLRLFEIERRFDAQRPENDEENVLDDGDGVKDDDSRLRVGRVLHVDVAENVDVG